VSLLTLPRRTALALLVAVALAPGLRAQALAQALVPGGVGAATRSASIELRLAEIQPADHPTARADFEFARLVRERSGGRIRVSVYTDSVLGQEVSVLEQLQFGAIDIARVSLSALAVYVPRLNALQMPYLYRNAEHMWMVLRGDIGRELLASVGSAGFVGLGWFEAGARNFYSSRRAWRSPTDLVGRKIRVQENQTMSDLVAAFGATPLQRPFGEIYSALETGEIDGAENNIPTYYSSRHYLIAPYYTLDGHARVPEIVLGSTIGLAALTEEDRLLLARAAMDTIDYQRAAWAEYEKLAESRLREAGVVFVGVPDTGPWRSLARRVYDRQPADILAIVARIRALK